MVTTVVHVENDNAYCRFRHVYSDRVTAIFRRIVTECERSNTSFSDRLWPGVIDLGRAAVYCRFCHKC